MPDLPAVPQGAMRPFTRVLGSGLLLLCLVVPSVCITGLEVKSPLVGDPVTLQCDNGSAHTDTQPEVLWKVNGTPLQWYEAGRWNRLDDHRVKMGDATKGDFSMTIVSVSHRDTGTYVCLVNGDEVQEFNLYVHGLVLISAHHGASVTLPCNKPLTGNTLLQPKVQWSINNTAVQSYEGGKWKQLGAEDYRTKMGDAQKKNFSLTIDGVTYSDAGKYMCHFDDKLVEEFELHIFNSTDNCSSSRSLILILMVILFNL
ncbi:polymeric immunoglobulin receptor-like [Arapaima gigas]